MPNREGRVAWLTLTLRRCARSLCPVHQMLQPRAEQVSSLSPSALAWSPSTVRRELRSQCPPKGTQPKAEREYAPSLSEPSWKRSKARREKGQVGVA